MSSGKILKQGTHFRVTENKSRVNKNLTIYRLFKRSPTNPDAWIMITQSRYIDKIQAEIDSRIYSQS